MMPTVDDLERRAFLAGDRQTLALLELMEQTVEERVGAAADALADRERTLIETRERIEGAASTLRSARPLKKSQMLALADLLDRLATDPPEGCRAGVEFDSALRRACGVGRT